MKCVYCAYCEPVLNKWACFNNKRKDGCFIRFVKPDDDYDVVIHCFEPASEYDMSLKKEYMKGIMEDEDFIPAPPHTCPHIIPHTIESIADITFQESEGTE